MKFPEEAVKAVTERYRNQHRRWLDGEGAWPWVIGLEPPSDREAASRWPEVRRWVDAWRSSRWSPDWETRQWPTVGTQEVPIRLVFDGPADAASFAGKGAPWQRAASRASALASRWPTLQGDLGWSFPELEAYEEAEFDLLIALTEWLLAHPQAGCYPRQIPLEGLHTKWLEQHEKVVWGLAKRLDPRPALEARDLRTWAGFRVEEPLVRLRVLDPELAAHVGGLTEVSATPSELARLPWKPKIVLIVENKTSGLALPQLSSAVAFIGLGNAVTQLEPISWIKSAKALYWGDIDTYGLAILGRARSALGAESLLMDEATLLRFRAQWSQETPQEATYDGRGLTDPERALLSALREGRWAEGVRLEQERIEWSYAWAQIRATVEHQKPSEG